MSCAVFHKPKTVRANDGAGVDNDAIADFNVTVNHNSGIEQAVVADPASLAYVTPRFDERPVSDDRAGLNHGSRAYLYAVSDFGIRRHGCTGVYSGVIRGFGQKPGGGTSERQLGVSHNDDGLGWEIPRSNNHTSRPAPDDVVVKSLLCIAEVVRPCIL